MTPLEYYLKRKEDSRQELATLIAQANQLIGDTHNSLNTHTNQVSNMGNIKNAFSTITAANKPY